MVNTTTITFAAAGRYTLQLNDMSGSVLQVKIAVANAGLTTVQLNMSRYTTGKYLLVLTDERQHKQTFGLSKQ